MKTSTLWIIGGIVLAAVSILGYFIYKSAQTVKEASDKVVAASGTAANQAGRGIVQGFEQGLSDLLGG